MLQTHSELVYWLVTKHYWPWHNLPGWQPEWSYPSQGQCWFKCRVVVTGHGTGTNLSCNISRHSKVAASKCYFKLCPPLLGGVASTQTRHHNPFDRLALIHWEPDRKANFTGLTSLDAFQSRNQWSRGAYKEVGDYWGRLDNPSAALSHSTTNTSFLQYDVDIVQKKKKKSGQSSTGYNKKTNTHTHTSQSELQANHKMKVFAWWSVF